MNGKAGRDAVLPPVNIVNIAMFTKVNKRGPRKGRRRCWHGICRAPSRLPKLACPRAIAGAA